jgi:hypothetical protein
VLHRNLSEGRCRRRHATDYSVVRVSPSVVAYSCRLAVTGRRWPLPLQGPPHGLRSTVRPLLGPQTRADGAVNESPLHQRRAHRR